ncbi:hypothetical protein D3C72_1990850 [compost metagenome]
MLEYIGIYLPVSYSHIRLNAVRKFFISNGIPFLLQIGRDTVLELVTVRPRVEADAQRLALLSGGMAARTRSFVIVAASRSEQSNSSNQQQRMNPFFLHRLFLPLEYLFLCKAGAN